jgi:hypothetical protein
LKVKQPDSIETFGFWGYGEPDALMVAGGLRVTDEGVAYNHHFLKINDVCYFPEGNYEIAPNKFPDASCANPLGKRLSAHSGCWENL